MIAAIISFTLLVSVAAVPEGTDAFLQHPQRLPLADAATLPPLARHALEYGAVTSVEPRYGVPSFFWFPRSPVARSARAQGLTPEESARQALFVTAPFYRHATEDVGQYRVLKVHDRGEGAVVVSFVQSPNGRPLFRDEVRVVLTHELEPVAIAGYLAPHVNRLGAEALTLETAVGVAYRELTGNLSYDVLDAKAEHRGTDVFFSGLPGASLARARAVEVPLPQGVQPAAYVELELDGPQGSRLEALTVSLTDGAILTRHSLTQSETFSWRVFASTTPPYLPFDGPQGNDYTPFPQGGAQALKFTFATPNQITLARGPISTTDDWLTAGQTTTDGNNAKAYADLASPDGFGPNDLLGLTSAPNSFDEAYDPTLQPNAGVMQQRAAIDQVFYDVNFFHDWYYDVGFDEKAGNGQASNYGRGGVEGDAMFAEINDYAGTNNASMSTPSDGAHPRLQMYIFDGGNGPRVVVPGAMPVTYSGGPAQFGPQVFTVSAKAGLVDDANATNGSTNNDGCQNTYTTSFAGMIAVVDRGQCTFVEKAQIAELKGAVGLIILNNTFGPAPDLTGMAPDVHIPVVSLSRSNSEALRQVLGSNPVLTLTRIDAVDKNSALDNSVVAHEWGHFISNRLIGDGSGLSNYQAYGMGEGWADFHSLLLIVAEGDDAKPGNANFSGTYATGAYAASGFEPRAPYFGIRRLPYSTDFSRNALTFRHIEAGVPLPAGVPTAFGADGRNNHETHATGEVWSSMLWECYAALLNSGLPFAEAQRKMRAYLVAGYKATPLFPTFVDARDGLLAAAAATDVADLKLFARAFARRGLGVRAVAPDRDSRTNGPLKESFISGGDVTVVSARLDDSANSCDADGVLDSQESGLLTLSLKNTGTETLAGLKGLVASSAPYTLLLPNPGFTVASLPPFASTTVTIPVSLKRVPGPAEVRLSIDLEDPSLAGGSVSHTALALRVGTDIKPKSGAFDDAEADATSWTFEEDTSLNVGSGFRRVEDSAIAHHFFGPDAASIADTRMVSPVLFVGSDADFVVTFSHRYDLEVSQGRFFDGAVIEYTLDNGKTWFDVGTALEGGYPGKIENGYNVLRNRPAFVGQSPRYPEYQTATLRFGPQFRSKSVRLRFRIGTDPAAGAKGWELDDLTFSGITNTPFTVVARDPASCTNHPPTISGPTALVADALDQVELWAVGSDADDDPVTIAFRQVAGPKVAVEGRRFVAPQVDAETTLTFTATADDGFAASAPLTVTVTVRPLLSPANIDIASHFEAVSGQTVTLAPRASTATGAVMATVVQTSGIPVLLTPVSELGYFFVAPEVSVDTTLLFKVQAGQATRQVEVLVHPVVAAADDTAGARGLGCQSTSGMDAAAWALGLLPVAALRRRTSRRRSA